MLKNIPKRGLLWSADRIIYNKLSDYAIKPPHKGNKNRQREEAECALETLVYPCYYVTPYVS